MEGQKCTELEAYLYNRVPFDTQTLEKVKNAEDAEEMAKILEKDPLLTTEILRIVNSPFFALAHEINDIRQAIAFLGLDNVRVLVITCQFLRLNAEKSKELRDLYDHSSLVAEIAKNLCIKIQNSDKAILNHEINKLVPSEIYIAALLHDIGKIFFYIDKNFESKFKLSIDQHPELGAFFLKCMSIPKNIIKLVLVHENPKLSKKMPLDVLILYIANLKANGKEIPKEVKEIFDQKVQILNGKKSFFKKVIK